MEEVDPHTYKQILKKSIKQYYRNPGNQSDDEGSVSSASCSDDEPSNQLTDSIPPNSLETVDEDYKSDTFSYSLPPFTGLSEVWGPSPCPQWTQEGYSMTDSYTGNCEIGQEPLCCQAAYYRGFAAGLLQQSQNRVLVRVPSSDKSYRRQMHYLLPNQRTLLDQMTSEIEVRYPYMRRAQYSTEPNRQTGKSTFSLDPQTRISEYTDDFLSSVYYQLYDLMPGAIYQESENSIVFGCRSPALLVRYAIALMPEQHKNNLMGRLDKLMYVQFQCSEIALVCCQYLAEITGTSQPLEESKQICEGIVPKAIRATFVTDEVGTPQWLICNPDCEDLIIRYVDNIAANYTLTAWVRFLMTHRLESSLTKQMIQVYTSKFSTFAFSMGGVRSLNELIRCCGEQGGSHINPLVEALFTNDDFLESCIWDECANFTVSLLAQYKVEKMAHYILSNYVSMSIHPYASYIVQNCLSDPQFAFYSIQFTDICLEHVKELMGSKRGLFCIRKTIVLARSNGSSKQAEFLESKIPSFHEPFARRTRQPDRSQS